MRRRSYFWTVSVGGADVDLASLWPDLHPAELDRMRAHMSRAIAERDDFELEHRSVRADGSTGWSQQRGVIERDARGNAVVLRGIATDITERKQAEQELRDELAIAERLQALSSDPIAEDQGETFSGPLLEAAAMIMRSDFASMQVIDPDRDALLLIGHRGFTPEAVEHLRWVARDAQTACGAAVTTGTRVIVSDAGDDLMCRKLGIRSMQSTPLISRRFQLLGVLSTCWRARHQPSERQLRSFDVLARKATELLERMRNEQALRAASWRDAYRVALTDALRRADDRSAVLSAATRLLGEYLQASRAYYAELDLANDACTIGDSYFKDGVVSMASTFRVGALAQTLTPEFRAGKTSVVRDCREIPDATPELVQHLEQTGRAAYIAVPIVKAGTLVGAVSVQSVEPRQWTRDEVAIVEETADRTWTALERLRSQTALVANETRLRLAIDATGFGTWMADFDRGVCVLDANLNRMLGFGAESSTHPIERLVWQLHTDDLHIHRRAWGDAIEHGVYSAEYRVKAADGMWRWVISRGRVLSDLDSRQLFGITLDMTERKQLEQTLCEADRRKDEFLATLAHELRNPLAPIVTGLEVLRLSDDIVTQERMVSMMEDQIKQMVHLVDDLLDVARINQGKIQLERAHVELDGIVQGVVQAMRPTYEAARHTLEVVLADEPIVVDADRTRIAQVLTNLLTNAARYTPNGGLIQLAVERDADDVVIRVRDNGNGMTPELLARAFDLFVQGHKSDGLGIGLALVKRMVELHGGTVHAHSDGPNAGSTFEVRLPIATAEPAVVPAQEVAPSVVNQRVLVVDDNVDAIRSLAVYLRMLGSEVETATDGRAALTVAERFKPDVILMDLGMPNLDGLAAARELRQLPWGATVRLIALTGWGHEADRRRTREAGFDVHLVKPVDPRALTQAIAG